VISRAEAEKVLASMRGKRVLVIGDLILDRYVWGRVDRISPEAPVPVVHVTRESVLPGGAANVAQNIRSLGAVATVAGFVGQDADAEAFVSLLEERGISTDGLIAGEGLRTTVKTRVVAERQQVVRFDCEDGPERSASLARELCLRVTGLIGGVDGVVLEDYGKGAVTQEVVEAVKSACAQRVVPVGFDPKEGHELDITGVTLATPNFREACWAAGLDVEQQPEDPTSDDRLTRAGDLVARKWDTELLIVTLGPYGIYLKSRGCEPRIIPTRAREVFDVSGAGDTVIAAALTAVAAGAGHEEAASLANYAAGVVCGKIGAASCTPAEILQAMKR